MEITGMIAGRGQLVVLRRQTSISPPACTDAVVHAVVNPRGVSALADTAGQETFEVIVAHDALAALGWPVPVRRNDEVVLEPDLVGGVYVDGTGRSLRVQAPGARGGVGYWMTTVG